MERFSNLVWLAASAVILITAARARRRNWIGIGPGTTLTAAFALCLLLLPVISMSDDLLQDRQNNLPLAAQTWHLASEGASAGLEVAPLLGTCLLALLLFCLTVPEPALPERQVRRHSTWLTRAQRLRPPPVSVL